MGPPHVFFFLTFSLLNHPQASQDPLKPLRISRIPRPLPAHQNSLGPPASTFRFSQVPWVSFRPSGSFEPPTPNLLQPSHLQIPSAHSQDHPQKPQGPSALSRKPWASALQAPPVPFSESPGQPQQLQDCLRPLLRTSLLPRPLGILSYSWPYHNQEPLGFPSDLHVPQSLSGP